MMKTILELVDQQPGVDPQFKHGVRLGCLEDTIMLARPDYCEAAESILTPMMAVLERRYGLRASASYQQLADVKHAYEKLFKALMVAQEAEES